MSGTCPQRPSLPTERPSMDSDTIGGAPRNDGSPNPPNAEPVGGSSDGPPPDAQYVSLQQPVPADGRDMLHSLVWHELGGHSVKLPSPLGPVFGLSLVSLAVDQIGLYRPGVAPPPPSS